MPLVLDVFLEALHVAVHAVLEHPEFVGGVLDETFRVDVHLRGDAGVVVVEAVEGDDARVLGSAVGFPRDAFVGMLFGDRGVEFTRGRTDVDTPVRVRVVELMHYLDALHELREGLELGPLVVGRADRYVHIHGGGQCAHDLPLSYDVSGLVLGYPVEAEQTAARRSRVRGLPVPRTGSSVAGVAFAQVGAPARTDDDRR